MTILFVFKSVHPGLAQTRLKSSLAISESCPGAFQGRDMMGAVPVGLMESDVIDDDDEDVSSEEGSGEIKIPRDDLRNPSWIEDKEVLNGPTGHLKMDEIEFWKGDAKSFIAYWCIKILKITFSA